MTGVGGPALPAGAYAAALAGLPGIGPASLVGLLGRHDPETAWSLVLAGEERRPDARPGVRTSAAPTPWHVAGRRVDVAAAWSALVDGRIGVTYLGQPGYPAALRDDPEPPGVVFWRGDLTVLDLRCVAVVGTRRCSHYGREVAFDIGRDLAGAGVCVASGLALGIDGAVHAGVLAAGAAGSLPGFPAGSAAGPVGIAASGVDVPYPRQHAALWLKVAAAGAVVSETAPGQQAQAWRFPARNRIIAAVASAVVVVESHAGGGSMLTVAAAIARGIEVMAVPGPVHSPASAGTNQLLVEGCCPVRHAGDVLDALGDVRPWPPPRQMALVGTDGGGGSGSDGPAAAGSDGPAAGGSSRPSLDPESRRTLDAVDWTATPPGVIAERCGLAVGPLSTTLHRLEARGLVREDGGRWMRVRGR
jgi:DNA processing protein